MESVIPRGRDHLQLFKPVPVFEIVGLK